MASGGLAGTRSRAPGGTAAQMLTAPVGNEQAAAGGLQATDQAAEPPCPRPAATGRAAPADGTDRTASGDPPGKRDPTDITSGLIPSPGASGAAGPRRSSAPDGHW